MWIPGYKPLSNLQGRLREVVVDRFTGDAELRAFMLRSVEDPNIEPSPLGLEVDPPAVGWPERSRHRAGVVGIDFAAIESLNRALGKAGEVAVVEGERARLSAGGRDDLAAEVRHVSVLDGDGLGYDVQSFQELTDEPVYIEVKTTRYGKELPFYISGNEVEASNDLGPAYRLRRLYRYGKRDSGYYTLLGPLGLNAQLKPDVYRGLPCSRLSGVGHGWCRLPHLRPQSDSRAPRNGARSNRPPRAAPWCRHHGRRCAGVWPTSSRRLLRAARAVLGAGVPVAAVDEDRDALLGEHDVRGPPQ